METDVGTGSWGANSGSCIYESIQYTLFFVSVYLTLSSSDFIFFSIIATSTAYLSRSMWNMDFKLTLT